MTEGKKRELCERNDLNRIRLIHGLPERAQTWTLKRGLVLYRGGRSKNTGPSSFPDGDKAAQENKKNLEESVLACDAEKTERVSLLAKKRKTPKTSSTKKQKKREEKKISREK